MDAFLRLPTERRRLLCEEGQHRLGLIPASIEKDFWVCWVLRELFNLSRWDEFLTFKGGTSLSKCWRLISRFSEDIDVVIDRHHLGFGGDTLSKKQQKRLVKECSRQIQEELWPSLEQRFREVLPAGLLWELTAAHEEEDPDQQTLLFHYPTVFHGAIAYVRPVVKIELGARSETEPVEIPFIQPYLAAAFPDLLRDSAFSIKTVTAERTFWEKAMLLHEETFRPAEKPRRARLSRHYYYLWCLIKKGIAAKAVADLKLFDRVARHRESFFKVGWVNYDSLRKGTLNLLPAPEQMNDWRRDYEAMREGMFFEEPPSFDEVLTVIRQFEEAFNRA
ncbi:MAG: nucleotidyl transferase AbiEii/AbiGii toxin family protein [Proteobacteria bacterium]|nr:nucleotidyl transferase AbiEii/AbiGii toxin family protein [Pseudomonadota bacterium]